MTTEIELKYLISANHEDNDLVADKITAMLKAQNRTFTLDRKQLNNNYFDNKDLALRKMDIGLRIRGVDQEYEQTVKTAGKVVGCLHQRPEYNVSLEGNHLDLLLFPKHIWPEHVDVVKLQKSLQVIFNTDFSRQTWLITQENCVIELALDRGEIFTSPNVETLAINEIEIELVSGEEQALFALAEQLMTVIQMKPGKLSKAARGYALYHQRDRT
ncbi:inorganic triphosphatase [Candidatus Colwellia aromaticivorans]|uniref:CYTH domain-containing protein n=1 Tax=Candidatus Colwellia aromaticivorans TaxID=2267621 RepID=UPI000DF2D261|nr:CYTH domain-containing protein [Candidatus Colwellia aromaticivorans]